MNIPKEPDDKCSDIVYDIIQNGLNINVENMHFLELEKLDLQPVMGTKSHDGQ